MKAYGTGFPGPRNMGQAAGSLAFSLRAARWRTRPQTLRRVVPSFRRDVVEQVRRTVREGLERTRDACFFFPAHFPLVGL
jgi:hypothetical protein